MKRKNFGRMLMAISAVGVTLSINSFCFANSVTDAQNQLNSIKNLSYLLGKMEDYPNGFIVYFYDSY